jgi:tetratricopeptide (TPR) repeat protein
MASSARIDELKKKFDENPRRYFAPLANEYRKAGDLDQAIFICQAYLPQQPGHMSGHIVYAQTLFEMGRFDESKAAFGTALALDPENMIALRHLGDIARQAGDFNTAREWYQRVLEADPRNEEIGEVMASLKGEYARGVTSSAPAAEAPPADTSAPPGPPAAISYPPPPPRPAPIVSAPATPPADDDFAEEHELLDLDSMMIGETPLSTPSVPAVETTRDASDEPKSDAPSVAADDHAAFESDPLAIAANDFPPLELATDLHLGLVDDGTQSDVAPTDAAPLEGLRSYEPGVIAERDQIVESSFEMEPFYDDVLHGNLTAPAPQAAKPESAAPSEEATPDELSLSESLSLEKEEDPFREKEGDAFRAEAGDLTFTPAEPAPATREPTPSVGAEIFVTETMAELYLQQGHLDSALDIYRKLLEQRPNDASLIERVRHVENQLFGPPEAPAAQAADLEMAPFVSLDIGLTETGPTIREFLTALIGRRAARGSDTNGAGEPHATPDQFTSRHTLPGSIDALFPQGDASTNDSNAATALGEAFGMSDIDADLTGEVAHQESTEAPTDRVPSGSTPSASQAAAEGFSFDQFFAGEANAAPPKPSSEMGGPPVESPEDIAQFNAWLNGLKKT